MMRQLQVETTNICNAHCSFCIHDRFEKYQTMEEGLYRKIVDDAAQYELECFIPMLTGEPLCDSDIMGRIEYARAKLRPETKIRLFTNGGLLTEQHIDQVASLPRTEISISINGETPERRYELMGLNDYGRVVQLIEYADRKGILAQVTSIWHPTMELSDVNKLGKFPRAAALTMHNWAGLLYPYRRTRPTNCGRMQNITTILANGDVVLCCFDPFGRVNFGNMNYITLEEAWENPIHQEYLEAHRRGKGQMLPLCAECTQG